jgi:hypothetical protein
MADASSPWTLDGNTASLRVGSFSAVVKIDEPGLGVHGVCWDGASIAAVETWLGFREYKQVRSEQVRPIEDAYVRGRDLVAVYAETPENPLRYEIYWRALDADSLCGAAAGIDVVASVQTSVLDAKPQTMLCSQCRVDAVWASAPPKRDWAAVRVPAMPDAKLDMQAYLREAHKVMAEHRPTLDDAFLFALAESPWAYAEMIHPADRLWTHVAARETSALRTAGTGYLIFGMPMEKGVLLRARLRVLLLPRSDAQEIALRSREQFERAELPLTT